MRSKLFLIFCLVYPLFAMSQKYDRDSLLHVLNLTDQPSKKVIVLNLLAKSYLEDDVNRSEIFARQALFISESINLDQGKAESLFYLGQLKLNNLLLDEAKNYFQDALEIFQKQDDQKWIAKSNLVLGEIYLEKYEFEKSLEVLFNAMNIFISIKKEKKLAETYNLIGLNYFDQGNNAKAFEYFQNGLIIVENKIPVEVTSSLLNNTGNIYLARKNYPEALKFYNKAISYNIIERKNYCLAINYAHIGRTYIELNKLDSAYYFLNLSLALSEKENNSYLLSLIKLNLGGYYKAVRKYDLASVELLECYELSIKNSIFSILTKVSKELSELYALQDNFEKAYYFHRQFKLISDSLSNIKNTERITNQEMKLLFSHEQELRKIEHQKSYLKYFSLVLALLTLLIIIITLFTRLKMKIKPSVAEAENLQLERAALQDKLDYKNRELTTNLMYMVKKNELINFISGKLQKAKENFRPQNKNKVQEIITYLQSNIDQNLWNEFEERFQETHKDFYTKLNNISPGLTKNDKRLCTFIRLNLSTKEIAGITHQNLNSIEVSRTRLRKKLNITNTDINLQTYLSNI